VTDIYEELGRRIREYRTHLNGTGISQEELARKIGTNSNSVSRWETAAYKPTLYDLEKLAELFNIPLAQFLPKSDLSPRFIALLGAVREMDDRDFEEVIRYALFKRAVAPIKV
jgi:transcriptional regulator with XRE-family HTH domain